MSDRYKIGYKRPPKATQWKKGQSGNPRGRPKHTRNFKTDLLEELGELILIYEQGTPKWVSKQRAAIKAQMAKSIKGDTKATAFLHSAAKTPDPEAVEDEQRTIDKEDLAIIDAFLQRQKKPRGGP